MQNFGEKLRALRERHNMTQWELARKLGFHQAHVYRLETGQRKPNVALAIKLADLFGVSLDMLLRDERGLEGTEDEGE